MSNYDKTKELIQSLSSQEESAAQESFKSLILNRIKDKLEVEKVRLAGQLYSEAAKSKIKEEDGIEGDAEEEPTADEPQTKKSDSEGNPESGSPRKDESAKKK